MVEVSLKAVLLKKTREEGENIEKRRKKEAVRVVGRVLWNNLNRRNSRIR